MEILHKPSNASDQIQKITFASKDCKVKSVSFLRVKFPPCCFLLLISYTQKTNWIFKRTQSDSIRCISPQSYHDDENPQNCYENITNGASIW